MKQRHKTLRVKHLRHKHSDLGQCGFKLAVKRRKIRALLMRENGKNDTMRTFILKISRKLRDCYLSGLAQVKVTCVTIFSPFFGSCVLWLISWER